MFDFLLPYCLLLISLALNIYMILSRKPGGNRKLDLSASDLLHDLTVTGSAILKVDVMDRDNLLLRLPRG